MTYPQAHFGGMYNPYEATQRQQERRNSLLSLSLLEFEESLPMRSHHQQAQAANSDPYAPLSLYEPVAFTSAPPNIRYLTEVSESSVPSVSAGVSHSFAYVEPQPMRAFAPMGLIGPVPPRSVSMGPQPITPDSIPTKINASGMLQPSTSLSGPPLSEDDGYNEEEDPSGRFKPFHEEKWSLRYKELAHFHQEHGHAAVPHTYPKNPMLARWVKRQRRQFKLMQDGKNSTMTTARLELLNQIGFVWDSHDVNWRKKLDDLVQFRAIHGHCNVPSNDSNKRLATWVKCNRRQYKLYWDGKPSAMTPERILELESVGFEWEIRANVQRKSVPLAASVRDDLTPLPVSAPGVFDGPLPFCS